MYDIDYRQYAIEPDGNYFQNPTNPGQTIYYQKIGSFTQDTRLFFEHKLKLNAVIRIDKNQFFNAKINPRLAAVYSPKDNHNFRISIQNGHRFPSIFEAFSNINSGGRKRIGGLPIMSNGIFENSYTQSSISLFQNTIQTDVNKNGSTLVDAIAKNQHLLQKNNYTYLQPEEVTAFEIGYKTLLKKNRLSIDFDFYYNQYKNLIAQIDANIPISNGFNAATNFQNTSSQDKYRLWTN